MNMNTKEHIRQNLPESTLLFATALIAAKDTSPDSFESTFLWATEVYTDPLSTIQQGGNATSEQINAMTRCRDFLACNVPRSFEVEIIILMMALTEDSWRFLRDEITVDELTASTEAFGVMVSQSIGMTATIPA
jgi:hypothetical protein